MTSLSIIIPTYNEKGNISLLSTSISTAFDGLNYEIIFVDDGSPDGTVKVIRSLVGFGKTIKLVERPGKFGLASAAAVGARAAKGEWVLVMDGDLSHPPEVARRLFDSRARADLIIASRNIDGSAGHEISTHRDFISNGAEFLSRPFVGNRTTDPMSGFFLVKKEFFEKTRIRVRGYKILLNLIYDNPQLKILDVPYIFAARHSGKTKLNLMEVINYLFDLVRLIWK